MSIFLFDIDNFKHYNDRNGHVAGDMLLRQLARLVQENVRKESTFGRFGGEEFLLILPDAAKAEAVRAADNVRELIADFRFAEASAQPLGCVSVSGGVAECPLDAQEGSALLESADEALYRPRGRAATESWPTSPTILGLAEAAEPTEKSALLLPDRRLGRRRLPRSPSDAREQGERGERGPEVPETAEARRATSNWSA